MDDLISRQAAINALTSHIMPHNNEDGTVTIGVMSKSSIKNILNKLPSAQPDLSEYSDKLWKKAYERGRTEALAEIVRCKECKYNSNTCGNYVNCDIIPQMFGRTVDNFCSMAERRTDNDN